VTNCRRRLEIAQISAEKRKVMEMTRPHRSIAWRCVVLPVITLAFAAAGYCAQAQPNASALQPPAAAMPLPPLPPGAVRTAPGPTITAPGRGFGGSTAQAFPPPQSPPVPPPSNVKAGEGFLQTAARFGRGGAIVNGGLHWRVYADKPDQAGGFRLVKEDLAAQPNFVLPVGTYIVHVSLGLASAAKPVHLRNETLREMFDIPAGGLRIEGRVGNTRIPTGQISFDIFKGSQFEHGAGERRPLAAGVLTGQVVLVPEGTYYILSKYGDGNAVVRSDIRVQAGKLTDITVTHRAAAIMFKLVSKHGGEALANTDWAVLSPSTRSSPATTTRSTRRT
jgi:hypothetical protein